MKSILLAALLLLPLQNRNGNKILFVGDSMTAYTGGWQHQLAKKLGLPYSNLSVSGKRTEWMFSALKKQMIGYNVPVYDAVRDLRYTIRKCPYGVCFIYGGINDGFSYVKVESALNNVQAMVDLCNATGIKPVVIIGYDPDKVMVNTYIQNKEKEKFHRERYKTIQNLFASRLKNCKILPMDTTITRLDSGDGIHFKASGHKKFAEWVYKNY